MSFPLSFSIFLGHFSDQMFSFMSRYVCPALVSFLAISATLVVTLSILYWNYSETM